MAPQVNADIVDTYQRDGFGPAMAKFIQLVMHSGPLPADYLDQPAPDPVEFGLPTEDDGSRDDPLLSRNLAMPPFEPDAEAVRASSVRIVPAIGALGEGRMARRGGEALARLLGVDPVVFPGDHGGFVANEVVTRQRPGRVRREASRGARRELTRLSRPAPDSAIRARLDVCRVTRQRWLTAVARLRRFADHSAIWAAHSGTF